MALSNDALEVLRSFNRLGRTMAGDGLRQSSCTSNCIDAYAAVQELVDGGYATATAKGVTLTQSGADEAKKA